MAMNTVINNKKRINLEENNQAKKPKLVVLIGPTAVGKTACSVQLAAEIEGEIISGDSMQFYKYMDIGTAKITASEKIAANGQLIPHHFLDIIAPDEAYSVADFQKAATALVEEINQRGKTPILAGGTGLYVAALIDGYTLGEQASVDLVFRAAKRQEFIANGGEALWQELNQVDSAAAAKISPNDSKRLIRALEVYQLTGQAISQQAKQNPPNWDVTIIGLAMPREKLYERINQRVLKMIDDGLVTEVQTLLSMGYAADLKPMEGLGYKQICNYLAGLQTLPQAVAEIQQKTRNFAKRQLTWWRKDPRINWFEVENFENLPALTAAIRQKLQEN